MVKFHGMEWIYSIEIVSLVFKVQHCTTIHQSIDILSMAFLALDHSVESINRLLYDIIAIHDLAKSFWQNFNNSYFCLFSVHTSLCISRLDRIESTPVAELLFILMKWYLLNIFRQLNMYLCLWFSHLTAAQVFGWTHLVKWGGQIFPAEYGWTNCRAVLNFVQPFFNHFFSRHFSSPVPMFSLICP